jgi:chromosome segregation ATPase
MKLVRTMSASEEFEKLQNRKTELEEESRSLQQKERTLAEKAKTLEEKLAIQELERNNKNKQQSIKELEFKIIDLEKRLAGATEEPVAFTPADELTPEATESVQEENTENDVTVTAVEEPPIVQGAEHFAEDLRRQQEKKKRRLF